MDAIECMHTRRSIRAYRDEPVPRATIEELLWAAVQAPTPPISGHQPWAIVVVEGRDWLEDCGQQARQYAFEHQPPQRPWDWTVRPGFKVFWGAPVLVLLCARKGHAEAPLDCCRAGQNLLIAAQARGLGACWVGAPMPWLGQAQVQADLGVPGDFEPSVAIVLGFPAETPVGQPRPRPTIHWSSGDTAVLAPDPDPDPDPGTAPFAVKRIDHLVLRVSHVERSVAFYKALLGCEVVKRRDDLGLVHLRAGVSMIDLVSVQGPLGAKGGAPPGAQGRNMDHLCLRVEPFNEADILAFLRAAGVQHTSAAQNNFGAEGEGPSIYFSDPDGNEIELKGAAR